MDIEVTCCLNYKHQKSNKRASVCIYIYHLTYCLTYFLDHALGVLKRIIILNDPLYKTIFVLVIQCWFSGFYKVSNSLLLFVCVKER